jgi:hypothetical protein
MRWVVRGLSASGDSPDRVGVGSVVLGDEVGGGFHPPISGLTEDPCSSDAARFGGDAGQRVEGEDLDVGVAVAPGVADDGRDCSQSGLVGAIVLNC